MANDKDFIVKNPVEVGKDTKVTLGSITSNVLQGGYSLGDASYDSKSFSVASEESAPQGMWFKPDGTKMFIVGTSSDTVYQYTLSTAWDISTASYDSVSSSVSGQEITPNGVTFNSDGTKMFIVGATGDDVNEYTISTGWDLSSTVTFVDSFSVSSQDTYPEDVVFNDDGTKMFISGATSGDIYAYDLTTAYDVSTASYSSETLDSSVQDANPSGIYFKSDGLSLFVAGASSPDSVYKYDLTTAFDLSTATYSSTSFAVNSQDTSPRAVHFSDDGTKMYILGQVNGTVYQYSTASYAEQINLDTGNYFSDTLAANTTYTISNAGDVQSFQLEVTGGSIIDFSTATYNSVSFSTSAQNAGMLGVAFSTDGTKMYTSGTSGTEAVYQYTLTTAWDLSTASYASKSFDVSTQVTAAYDVDFSSDGTSMYVMDNGTDTLYQYTLSTAWDVSTASYASKSFDVSSQESNPTGFTFNDDGTKLYISGVGSNNTFQYDLSTAYDITTASYNNVSLFTGAGGADVYQSHRSLVFAQGGTKLFTLGTSGVDYINQFNLTTPYDISTGSFSGIQFDIDVVATGGKAGFAFAPDNVGKFYIVTGGTTDTINEIDMTTSDATLTWPTSIEWAGSVAPAAPGTGETDLFTFSTDDGGTTYQGFKTADNLS